MKCYNNIKINVEIKNKNSGPNQIYKMRNSLKRTKITTYLMKIYQYFKLRHDKIFLYYAIEL